MVATDRGEADGHAGTKQAVRGQLGIKTTFIKMGSIKIGMERPGGQLITWMAATDRGEVQEHSGAKQTKRRQQEIKRKPKKRGIREKKLMVPSETEEHQHRRAVERGAGHKEKKEEEEEEGGGLATQEPVETNVLL